MADKTQKTAGKPDTVAQALNAGRDVIERARKLLPSIPEAPQRAVPATLGDAQALVQERQQQALQHKEPKPKHKGQAAPAPEQTFPGSRIGGANDSSAYWTLVEEYFRDVTRQDFVNLLSFCVDPDDDDALLVPQLGMPKDNAEEPQPQLHLPASAPSMKAFGGYNRASGIVPAAADEGDDAHERKRSSRLAGKAMRRDHADRYDDYSHDSSSATLQQLPSPYCLLEQVPASDILMMTYVSMQLQQLSTADVSAVVGIDQHSLESLLQQASEPRKPAAINSAQQNPSGSSSKHHKQRDAAAGSSWALMSAGIGGAQLTAKQRQALVGWLQKQCAAPQVGQNLCGPVAAPWSPPPEQPAAATAAVAVEPADRVVATCVAPAAAAAVNTAAGGQQLQPSDAAAEQQSGAAAGSTDAGIPSSAVDQTPAAAAAAGAAGPLDTADVAAADSAREPQAAAAADGDATPAPATTELVTAASPTGFPEAQLDLLPQEIAAAAAAVVAAASAPPPAAADAPDENEVWLAADKAKREEMRRAEHARRRAEARLELHPYIRALLSRPLPPHIADPGWDIQELCEDEPDEAAAASAAAAETAAAAGDAAGAVGASAFRTNKGGKFAAAAAKRAGSVSTAAAADSVAAAGDEEASAAECSPAIGGSSGLPPSSSSTAGRGGKAGAGRGKVKGRGRWGGRKSGPGRGSKSGAAGKAGGIAGVGGGGAAAAGGGAGGAGSGGVDSGDAKEKRPPCAAAQAVHAIITAAPPEGSLEQQWQLLDESADVISLAPDDEVLAELLALQGELLQQTAINRARLGAVLQAALDDLPRQAEAAAERARWEADIVNYAVAVREARKEAKRLRREAERRAAAEQLAAAEPLSPRNTAARAATRIREGRGSLRGFDWLLGSETDDERAEARERSPAGPKAVHGSQAAAGEAAEVLADTLASRDTDDALCAVCGEGHSEAPNQIIFCERCDLPVHQLCYCVDVIPEGEWLCWPCADYEEQQRRAGVPQAEIRPPRWQLGAGGGAEPLPGGSRGVQCALCPVNCGAFKQAKDGRWVHMVCALWHQETRVDQVNGPEAVSGLDKLEARLAAPSTHVCQVCRRASGVTVRCAFGHCSSYFHPLCARARGQHLAIRPGVKTGLMYRAYCLTHSDAQRQKDREAAERAAAAMFAGPPAKQGRRGRPPAGALAEDYYTDALLLAEHEVAAEAVPVPGALVAAPRPEVDPSVLQGIASKEQCCWLLQGVRLELEGARLLADQVRRREKLKLALAKMMGELHDARLEEPVEGLAALAAGIAAHEPAVAAARSAAAVVGLDFNAEAAAAAAALPAMPGVAKAQQQQQQQQVAIAGLQDALDVMQQLGAADATPAAMCAPAAAELGAAPPAAAAPQVAAATTVDGAAASGPPVASVSAVADTAAAAARDSVVGMGSTEQSAASTSMKLLKQPVTGNKRKQPPAAIEAAALMEAPLDDTRTEGSDLAAAAAAAPAGPLAATPGSASQQQQQQLPRPVPVAEVPIVLSAIAKRRRTAGPGGPGRRGGTGMTSPTAADAAAAGGTGSTIIARARLGTGRDGSAAADTTALDKGFSEPDSAAVLSQLAPVRQQQQQATQASAPQQASDHSRAAGSRKRARPASDQAEAAVEVPSTAAAAAVQVADGMQAGPSVAAAVVAQLQHAGQQGGADALAAAAAAAAAQNALELEPQANADGSNVVTAAAVAEAAAGREQLDAAAASEQEPDNQPPVPAGSANEQQHDHLSKPPRRSDHRKRAMATELRLLQADLAHSSFQPTQGRSRRGSRDGGSSSGGGAPTAAALEAALATAAGGAAAEQRQRPLSPVREQTPAAAEVIQEAFPTVDSCAVGTIGEHQLADGDAAGTAALAAAAAADQADQPAAAVAGSDDPISPAGASHQRHQPSSVASGTASKKARVSGTGGPSSKAGQGPRR